MYYAVGLKIIRCADIAEFTYDFYSAAESVGTHSLFCSADGCGFVTLLLRLKIAKLSKPINDIDRNFRKDETYEEIRPLVNKIAEQNKALNIQNKQAADDVDKGRLAEAEFSKRIYCQRISQTENAADLDFRLCGNRKDSIVKVGGYSRFAGRIYDEARRLVQLSGGHNKLSQLDRSRLRLTKKG